MAVRDIQERERHERETYRRVGSTGRSALADEALRVPEHQIERYQAVRPGSRARYTLEQMVSWAGPLPGRRVLELCCHDAEHGTILARLGAQVDAIDIAEPLIQQARRRAEINGVASRLTPKVMSAHALEYPDATFDVVFGKASLHHLDLTAARDEVYRVLRPGGVGVFAEPITYSRVLGALRRVTPVPVDRESPDERQLTEAELREFCGPFASARFAHFHLLTRLSRVAPALGHRLAGLDATLMALLPPLRRLSGICVFAVTR
ncbi:MAG TPA: class I SAM-dependent methyltransferase [Armatimonadota bacterium]|jgi:ubiquinone/menaquinone biosynthesis C-methylase UbiE